MAALTLLALLFELMIGYPDRLVGAIGHPVTGMGALIGALDRGLNRDTALPTAAMRIRTATVPAIRRAAGGAVSRLRPRSSAPIKAPIQVTGWPIARTKGSG